MEEAIIRTCPDEERLAAFVEGAMSDVERARVEAHVSTCATCLDVVTAVLPASPRTAADVGPSPLTPVVTTPAPRTRVGRRWRRLAIAAGVIAATGGTLFGVYEQRIARRAGPVVADYATRLLGVPVRASALGVGLSGITLKDVTIGKADGHPVRVDEVGIGIALSAPFTDEPVLRSVRLVRPVVDLRGASADGALPRIERGPLAALFARAGTFELVDAHLVLPVSATQSLDIDALNGAVERFAGGARLALHGGFAGGAIDVTGTLTNDGQRLTLTIGGRGLEALALPISYGRLTGTADLRVDLTEVGTAQRVSGRIAIRNGRVLGLRPLALAPISDASREALAKLRPELALDHLPFEDARAVFALRDGVWRLPRVFMAGNGFLAGGRARVAGIGEVAGRGTLRMPADVVAAVVPFEPRLEELRDQAGTATVPFTITGPLVMPSVVLRGR
jgi:hypothetical protein